MYLYLCLGVTSSIALDAQITAKPIENLHVAVMLCGVLLWLYCCWYWNWLVSATPTAATHRANTSVVTAWSLDMSVINAQCYRSSCTRELYS